MRVSFRKLTFKYPDSGKETLLPLEQSRIDFRDPHDTEVYEQLVERAVRKAPTPTEAQRLDTRTQPE